MIIKGTPYTLSTKIVTQPSFETPWSSVTEVVRAMGDGYLFKGVRMVIYAQGDDAIIYSDVDYGVNRG